MIIRNSFASTLIASVLTLALLAPLAAHSASAGKSGKKHRERARNYVLESKHRGHRRARTQRIYLPVGPSYIYYDYPYYYRRGYYPTHIGGYVYYNPKFHGRCSNKYWRCRAHQREGCTCR